MAKLINYLSDGRALKANADKIKSATNTEALNAAYAEKVAILAPKLNEIEHDLLRATGRRYKMNPQGSFSLVAHSMTPWRERAEDITFTRKEPDDADAQRQREKLNTMGIEGSTLFIDGKKNFVIDPAQENFFLNLKTARGTVESGPRKRFSPSAKDDLAR